MLFQTGSRTCCYLNVLGGIPVVQKVFPGTVLFCFWNRSLGTAEPSRDSRSQFITVLWGPACSHQEGCDFMSTVLERPMGGGGEGGK